MNQHWLQVARLIGASLLTVFGGDGSQIDNFDDF